jgi:hypothetical protein
LINSLLVDLLEVDDLEVCVNSINFIEITKLPDPLGEEELNKLLVEGIVVHLLTNLPKTSKINRALPLGI